MATIRRFEDAECWQSARDLNRQVYRLTKGPAFRRDRALVEQMRRASISAMSNIAEGIFKRTNKELASALGIARGSTGEVQSQLYAALDEQYVTPADFAAAYAAAEITAKRIYAWLKYLEPQSESVDHNHQPRTINHRRSLS